MMHFCFSDKLTYAQIQLFAKTVKCMMQDEFSFENECLLDITLPDGIELLKELYDICLKNQNNPVFYVSTPDHPNIEYVSGRTRQIPNLDTSLYLRCLQIAFDEYKNHSTDYIKLSDRMLVAFISINTDITNLYVQQASNEGVFDWKEKYEPCFVNIDKLRQFKEQIILAATLKGEKKETAKYCAEGVLMDFAYQCGFLAFWCCLLDVVTCPCCTDEEKEVLGNLAQFFMKYYSDIYVYNLVVEADSVKNANHTEERGSADNTTRVKMYYTMADDRPILMRLDLPHVGYPYVHLNIEDGDDNYHYPLSQDVNDGRYDHVFDELQKALLQYNFNATDFYHSPVATDKEIMKDMRYRTAILNYSICALFYAIIGEKSRICLDSVIIKARATLEELLVSDIIKKEELAELNPNDILEMAMGEIK